MMTPMFSAVGETEWERLEAVTAKLKELTDAQRAEAISRIAAEGAESPALINLLLMSYPPEERPSMLFEPGDVIADRYEIVSEIGEGGMGVVYEAVQAHTHRRVALKVIRPYLLTGGAAEAYLSERFSREIAILGELSHPGIVTIYEAGTIPMPGARQSALFFAMELVDGVTLEEYGEKRRLNEKEAALLMELICDAVGHAHEHGIVHRDLKPSNILVRGDGSPVVLDFGLANASLEVADREGSLLLSGTPEYMSPELLVPLETGNLPSGEASDVYALGVVAYELVTGTRLHAHDRKKTMRELRDAILAAPAPKVRSKVKNPRLARVLTVALKRDPKERYDSVKALGSALRAAVTPVVSPMVLVVILSIALVAIGGRFLLMSYATDARTARELSELERALVGGERERGLNLLATVQSRAEVVAFRSKAAALLALPSGLRVERTPLEARASDSSVVFSRDGTHYALPGEEGSVQIYDGKTKLLQGTLAQRMQHDPYVPGSREPGAMAFSPNGKRLAVASLASLHVFIWDVDRMAVDGLLYHSAPVSALDWVWEDVLVTGTIDGRVCEWKTMPTNGAVDDVAEGGYEATPGAAVLAMDQCQSSDLIALLSADEVRIRKVSTGEILATQALDGEKYQNVQLLDDGTSVELRGETSTRLRWWSEAPAYHRSISQAPLGIDWTPGQRCLVMTLGDELAILDVEAGQWVSKAKASLGGGVAVSVQSKTLYTTDRFGVHAWDVMGDVWRVRDQEPDDLRIESAPYSPLALSDSSGLLAVITGPTLRIVDLVRKGTRMSVDLVDLKARELTFSPTGDFLAIVGDIGVRLYGRSGSVWTMKEEFLGACNVAFDKNGSALCLAFESGELRRVRLSGSGAEEGVLLGNGTQIAVSGDGNSFLTGSATSDLALRRFPSGEVITQLVYPIEEPISRLLLSENAQVAIAVTDTRLIVWNLQRLNEQLSFYQLHWDSPGGTPPVTPAPRYRFQPENS